jgi:hypothetical protein
VGDFLAECDDGVVAVPSPWGEVYHVSLKPVSAEDPRLFMEILLQVSADNEPFGSAHSGAVVLGEFELPPYTHIPGDEQPASGEQP